MRLKLFGTSHKRASRINVTPPSPRPDRRGLALCAIMRNEEANIADWLRFHALAGVRDFLLYDNLSDDKTILAAQSVPNINVTVLPWKIRAVTETGSLFLPQQILAYCHAIATFGAGYRWVGFIDIDEFLVPVKLDSLPEALEPLEAYSNISLPWVMFGHSGHDLPSPEATPFAYQRRSRHQSGSLLNYKCIVDPCSVSQVSVHKFRTLDMGAKTANDQGKVAHIKMRNNAGFVSTESIQLNHYYTRSKQELENKIAGGAVSGVERYRREEAIREKINLIESDPVKDTTAVDFLKRKGVPDTLEFRRFEVVA